MSLQRSLQNGRKGLPSHVASFLHLGQRIFFIRSRRFRIADFGLKDRADSLNPQSAIQNSAYDNSQEIVLEGLSYLNGPKVAWTDLSGLGVIDQTHAVDLRRLRFQPTLQKQITFLGWPFDQDGKFPSDEAPILPGCD